MNKDTAMDLAIDWLDRNVVSAYPEKSFARLAAYAGLGAGRVMLGDELERNRKFLEASHVLSGDDLDLDGLHAILSPAMQKTGAVEKEWLGVKFTFKPDNLEDLFNHVRGGAQ